MSRPRRSARPLKALPAGRVAIFKVRNRRSYAAVALGNLTEGNSPSQAFRRLLHPLRRMGYALPARVPAVRAGA